MIGDRFWSKVDADGACWDWVAGRGRLGYGTFYLDGKNRKAHRVAYEELVGPIPEGLELDHLCRNRGCVNPDHLEPVTHAENVRRGTSPAVRNATRTHCPRGHPYSEANTYTSRRGSRGCRECRRAAVRACRARRKEALLNEINGKR